jgi:hypothetical protein
MIRKIFCIVLSCFLFGLFGLACADYGEYEDPECVGVICNSPPEATCIDSQTVRTYKSPGNCGAGICSYANEDITCAEGECKDGVCEGCAPACGTRECGPDPRCGHSCGDCIGCEDESDPSLCTSQGSCMQVCCPDCSGRQCGDDGCGGACGSCEPGCSCNSEGLCECGCSTPYYPHDCSLVDYFQCGFDGYCDDGEIHVAWHEHVMCNGQEEIFEFTCSYTCPDGCEEGGYIEWADNGEQLVANSCQGQDASCSGVLIDNEGPPGLYPFFYAEPHGADERFLEDQAAFLSKYNVTLNDYDVAAHMATWTPDVDKRYNGGAWITVYDIELSEANLEDVALGFIFENAEFFKSEDAIIQVRSSICTGSTCRVNFDQSYCGLEVVSPDPAYFGTLSFHAGQQDAGLKRAVSSLVPMIPIGKNPYVSQEAAMAGLLGRQLEYWCADGVHYATISEQSGFSFGEDPVVFVQTAPTGIIALEYRLAYRITVTVESFFTWTAYVDAFDGTLLKIDADFICD